MEHQEVADIIQTILDQNELDDKVARQLLLALTMDTRGRAVDHYQQTQNELPNFAGSSKPRPPQSTSSLP